jgi:hypothetical protein
MQMLLQDVAALQTNIAYTSHSNPHKRHHTAAAIPALQLFSGWPGGEGGLLLELALSHF